MAVEERDLPKKARDPFWDVLKFLAMLLVVFSHVNVEFPCGILEPYLDNFRVGMNMPLFFIISGYFAAISGLWPGFRSEEGAVVGQSWLRRCSSYSVT